jgi:hypothetical protein
MWKIRWHELKTCYELKWHLSPPKNKTLDAQGTGKHYLAHIIHSYPLAWWPRVCHPHSCAAGTVRNPPLHHRRATRRLSVVKWKICTFCKYISSGIIQTPPFLIWLAMRCSTCRGRLDHIIKSFSVNRLVRRSNYPTQKKIALQVAVI